jgi:hypothetical protein
MSMSTHIVGFAAPDEKWKRMRAVWDACEDAGVPAPSEVLEFFNYEAPTEAGVTIPLEGHESVTAYKRDMQDGFEIDVRKLPGNVQFVRFYNSY